jgi:hypothetical protein
MRGSSVGANGAYKNYVIDSRLVALVRLLDFRARQIHSNGDWPSLLFGSLRLSIFPLISLLCFVTFVTWSFDVSHAWSPHNVRPYVFGSL